MINLIRKLSKSSQASKLFLNGKNPDKKGRVPTSIQIDPDLWKQAKNEAIHEIQNYQTWLKML